MTYSEAMLVLDRRRNGADLDQDTINQALEMTGDLEHIPFSTATAQEDL